MHAKWSEWSGGGGEASGLKGRWAYGIAVAKLLSACTCAPASHSSSCTLNGTRRGGDARRAHAERLEKIAELTSRFAALIFVRKNKKRRARPPSIDR